MDDRWTELRGYSSRNPGFLSSDLVFGKCTAGGRARLVDTTQETVLAAKPLFKAVGQVAFTLASHLKPQQRRGVRPAADYGGADGPPRVL